MKNTSFFFIAVFLLAGPASSQVRIGLIAGFTGATAGANAIYTPGTQPSQVGYSGGKVRPTFHAGAIVDIPLTRILYLQPGLQYSGRGDKGRIDIDMPVEPGLSNWVTTTHTIRYHTMALPVNLFAKFTLSNGRLFGGGGPFFGYGVAGDVKQVNQAPRRVSKTDIRFGSGDDESSRFFLGINAAAGYEFAQRWMAALNFNRAIVSNEYGNTFGVSLGYFVNR